MRILGALVLFAAAPLLSQETRLRIRVIDPARFTIPYAEVALLDSNEKPVKVIKTNEAGVGRPASR